MKNIVEKIVLGLVLAEEHKRAVIEFREQKPFWQGWLKDNAVFRVQSNEAIRD